MTSLCPDCGRMFGGDRAFQDAHRFNACASNDELRTRGLHLVKGIWRQRPPDVVASTTLQGRLPLRRAGAGTDED